MNTNVIMGSSCSMQRHHDEYYNNSNSRRGRNGGKNNYLTDGYDPTNRSSHHQFHFASQTIATRNANRHSVVCAIPDGCIESLYPIEDNYISVGNHLRSPKSLSDLCVDTICRSISYIDGELPCGLPQDVVNDIIQSLIQHSAFTATTIRVLKNCELNTLSLAGCRGVTDAWLEPLASTNSEYNSGSNSSSPSNSNTSSPISCRPMREADMDHIIDPMDLEASNDQQQQPGDVFYGAFDTATNSKWAKYSATSAANDTSPDGDEHLSTCSSFLSAIENDHNNGHTATDDDHHCLLKYNQPYSSASVTMNITLLDIRGSHSLTDRGLMQLMNLQSLEVAKLDNCHSITGRGLLAFCHSHSLHTLSLANCRRLTDEAVINISHLLSLQALSLGGCRCITDRSLAAIAELYKLQKLDLSQCDLITDRGLQQLQHLSSIQELSLGWCRQITDVGIDMLTSHHGRDVNLTVLRLSRCPLTDVGVVHLGRLVSLEELDLNGCSNIGSAVLGAALEKMKQLAILDVSYCPSIIRSNWQGKINALKSLDLCYSSVKDVHLTKFTFLPALEELNLDSCLVGDAAIGHLADNNVVPNLTSLDLADTNLTDVGMAKIAKFTKLIRLSLFYCNITNSGLKQISKLTELQVLNLDSRDISDEGLAKLQKLKKLKSLDVFSGRITDAGCVHIAKIKSLESLELCGGGVGDLGCSLLASLDNLISLNLSQNDRITNRGAAALATLTNLKALNLSNTRVNSSALRLFSGLLKLQSLALYGCRGIEDDNDLGKLRNGLPNLRCIRLNTSSDEDGMVMKHENDTDDDDDDESIDAAAAVWNNFHNEVVDDDDNNNMDDDASIYSDHD